MKLWSEPVDPRGAALAVFLAALTVSIPAARGVAGASPEAGPATPAAAPPGADPSGVVTLADVRAAVLASSPRLAGLAAEVEARRARALQAGLLPNPEVALELENVGGTGDREAFEETETTLWVAQLVPLGGKRGRTRRVAELEGDAAAWSLEAARRDALADATKAFFAALAAQERVAVAEELERLAVASARAVGRQVGAGAASPADEARARLEVTRAAMERSAAERQLAARRVALAATWGSDAPRFTALRGDLFAIADVPTMDELRGTLPASPDVALRETQIAQSEAAIGLEEARRIPDPTIRLGARHFHDNDDDALVFEVAVPLPIFDQNTGNVAAAGHDLARARAERDAALAAGAAALAIHYEALRAAAEEAALLRDRALPEARAAFHAARAGYEQGVLGQLDALAAQRTLFELRRSQVDALAAYHDAAAEIERLTGRRLGAAAEEAR